MVTREQGIKILLGILVGHHDFVTAFCRKSAQHATLFLSEFQQCPMSNRQGSCEVLASGFSHRCPFAARHDNNLWHCLYGILNDPLEQCDAGARDTASLLWSSEAGG